MSMKMLPLFVLSVLTGFTVGLLQEITRGILTGQDVSPAKDGPDTARQWPVLGQRWTSGVTARMGAESGHKGTGCGHGAVQS